MSATKPRLVHLVRVYDSQREGAVLVSGWQVQAQVTVASGRKIAPLTIALCPEESDAEEITALLNAKYGGDDAAADSTRETIKGLPPLDLAGVLWVAALDRVPIEERIEWVQEMVERVESLNAMRAAYVRGPSVGS